MTFFVRKCGSLSLTSGHRNVKINFSPDIIEYGTEVILCIDVNFVFFTQNIS